jgi:hypothetical protein
LIAGRSRGHQDDREWIIALIAAAIVMLSFAWMRVALMMARGGRLERWRRA